MYFRGDAWCSAFGVLGMGKAVSVSQVLTVRPFAFNGEAI
jgi:hypothetical protein